MKKIDPEINRERVKASKEKSDIIYVTLPKGTKEKMEKLTNERLVAYARRMILNDLDKREEEQKKNHILIRRNYPKSDQRSTSTWVLS